MSGIYLPIKVAIRAHKGPDRTKMQLRKVNQPQKIFHWQYLFLLQKIPEQDVVELDVAVVGLVLAGPLHEVDELFLAVDVHDCSEEVVGLVGKGDKVLRVECLDTK